MQSDERQADGDGSEQLSFAELSDLIQSGKPIPGIKEIPDVLNEQQPSEAQIARPHAGDAPGLLKPWQRPTQI